MVETGVVEVADGFGDGEDWSAKEVLHECWRRYSEVKRTVQTNKGTAYMPTEKAINVKKARIN